MKKKILVVDDEPMILTIIETYLQRRFEVLTFDNTSSLLEYYKTEGADLVISDFYMPDATGEELCRKIQEIRPCPLVLISGSIVEKDKTLEAAAFIKKPFGPQSLLKIVEDKIGVDHETK